ncbi:hypothetical protein ABLE92_17135 [Gordonia sp. VNQ95]|uniref:hypothetical protein n=1 Tax=Gordonia sp. VNQ95 TaxID=3156619 RepID=UPI0032B51716
MTAPHDGPITGPRPGPHLMPGAAPSPGPGPDVDPALADVVTEQVHDLLGQVDDIREQTGDAFDLVALARQTQLLEQAHEVLTSALSEVDHR